MADLFLTHYFLAYMPHIAVGAEIGYIVSHLVLFYE